MSDPTVAPYWNLKTHILFISASGDWDEAKRWRETAEDIYRGVLEEVGKGKMRAETEQEALRQIRRDLDQIQTWQEEESAYGDGGIEDVGKAAEEEGEEHGTSRRRAAAVDGDSAKGNTESEVEVRIVHTLPNCCN